MKKISTNVPAPASTETPQAEPSQDEIARRAHELWLQDGCPTGRAIYHWHEAERQLKKDRVPSSTKQTQSPQKDRSLTSLADDSSPFNAMEEDAPLSVKVERNLAKTSIKSTPASGGSVNVD
ncbi:MAG: DUF2934 domain-containing protein [Nibricoccus sp.]